MKTLLLWMLVINLGVAFGAGLYEHRIVVSRWISATSDEGWHWNRDHAQRDDPGRRFWVYVTTIPLTILTLANLVAAWGIAGPAGGWWLSASLAALADRVFTFAYFVPAMIVLMRSPDSPASASSAARWSHLNYVRHAIVLTAWLAALRAFALVQQRA